MTRFGTILRVSSLSFLLILGTPISVSAQEKTELEKLSDRVKDLEKKLQETTEEEIVPE